ncbi:hypothetical protein M4R22_04800 [Acidovorax sp. GBBC 3334]|uniref:hypothetical protein n=1 Tax=Acidovorax sp. GBBC 3334 TaxID=2940496 RepID=UPI002304510E|nr:hypothetical protein [Acidovorax sp. GBBC 3334]MDA8454077.1 hypothetical protein [Acidovorax sp. GBBC 3334]
MSDFAILILSCDKYSDLWAPFMDQFRKQFPENIYPVYFGTNEIPFSENGVIPVLSGEDRDWSSSFRAILQQIPAKKVFVILEDLMVATKIDPARFRHCVEFIDRHDALHLKYWNHIKTDLDTSDPAIGEFKRGAPYRATVAAFWDRNYLLKLLLDGENPWNFEIMGSYRTSYSDGFYGMKEPLFDFVNLVEKGHWIPDSLDWAKKEGVALNVAKRPALTGQRGRIAVLQTLYFGWMARVPWQRRLRWMQTLRRALICY